MKKITDRLLNSKIVILIISIVAAFALQQYVVTIQNPVNTQTMTFQVEYEGEEQLLELYSLRLSNSTPTELLMRVEATRSDLTKMEASPVIVVDLSGVKDASDDYQIKYAVQYPSGLSNNGVSVTTTNGNDYISLDILKVMTKTIEFDLSGREFSPASDEYVIQEPVINTESLVVDGPEDIVSEIAYASISLEVDELLSKTTTYEMGYRLVLGDGTVLSESDMEEITVDHETVSVTIPVKMVKEVPLIIGEYIYGGGVTEENFSKYVSVNIKPSTVQLIGDESVLETIESVDLGSVDLTSFTREFSAMLAIKAPDGTEINTGNTEAEVNISISGLATKEFSVTNISCINTTAGYSADIETEAIIVTVRGPEASLAELEAGNIRITVDLDEFGEVTGRHSISEQVTVSVDSDTVGALNFNYTIVVVFSKI